MQKKLERDLIFTVDRHFYAKVENLLLLPRWFFTFKIVLKKVWGKVSEEQNVQLKSGFVSLD